MSTHLLYSVKDFVATVTVNRPEVRNALNIAVMEELAEVFRLIKNDPAVRVVVLTGAGDKAFVAGADISEIAPLSPTAGEEFSRRGQTVFDGIEQVGKPTIAAVNGYALGGGCELAMACSMRIASEKAVFGQPEVKLGLIPGFGGTVRLPRLVGSSRAMRMILTGETISAVEAFRIGLVDSVVPPAELLGAAYEVARKIAGNAPLAVVAGMEAVRRREALAEAALFGSLCATQDKHEGTRAFLEKRAPQFEGR